MPPSVQMREKCKAGLKVSACLVGAKEYSGSSHYERIDLEYYRGHHQSQTLHW